MSVPVNQRTHGKLEAYSKALELATYTLRITKNKKVFTEEYQEPLTNYIIEAALDIYLLIGSANDINIRSKSDERSFEERIALQRKSIVRCNDLKKLIFLAKPIFHLSSKRVKHWTNLTNEIINLVKGWINSDIKRFTSLIEDK